jgi:carbon-monoxide dehydrogenase medium subunit
MKPAAFRYEAPSTLTDALDLLAQYGWDAKPLAGGQSLVPMMNLRLARPAVLIDVNRVSELAGMEVTENAIRVGALTRHQELITEPRIRRHVGVLSDAARHIGHLAIRTRGTLGGSLAHADPAAELPLMAVTLDARILVASRRGAREVPAPDFFQGVFTTDLAPEELVVGVRWPRLDRPRLGAAMQEVSLRTGDFALVACAAVVEVDPHGVVTRVQVGLGGVGPGPVRARTVEAAAIGQASADEVAAAASTVVEDIDPASDLHATADYRRHLARVLTGDVLQAAYRRAVGTAD